MANVLIRNIPDAVLQHYRDRAAARGVSVNTVLREAVEHQAKPSMQTRLERAAALRAGLPFDAAIGSVAMLVESRADRSEELE